MSEPEITEPCEHEWECHHDWGGDAGVIGGTFDICEKHCLQCGAVEGCADGDCDDDSYYDSCDECDS